ncbi:MAG: hypothetical protein QNL96_07545, partial [SAR86 cluster bacterium]
KSCRPDQIRGFALRAKHECRKVFRISENTERQSQTPAPTKTTAQNRNTERQSQTPAPTKTAVQNRNAGGESQRDTPRGKPSDLNSPAHKWKGS